jgi:hypothetical protein
MLHFPMSTSASHSNLRCGGFEPIQCECEFRWPRCCPCKDHQLLRLASDQNPAYGRARRTSSRCYSHSFADWAPCLVSIHPYQLHQYGYVALACFDTIWLYALATAAYSLIQMAHTIRVFSPIPSLISRCILKIFFA